MNIINLSIGFAPGFDYGIVTDAIEQLHKLGVVVVVANGNSGLDGLFMSEAPAIAKNAIAVGSMNNIIYKDLSKAVINGQSILFDFQWEHPWFYSLNTATVYFVDGCSSYEVEPRSIALVEMDDNCPLKQKVRIAKHHNVELLMVILKDGYLNTYQDIKYPIMYVTNPDGQTLKLIIAEQHANQMSLKFTKETIKTRLPGGGEPSDFSSIGLGSELQLKPEIGAPGHFIYSSLPKSHCQNRDCYATWSGTSMATPYISGVAALYLEEFKDPTDFKSALMLTASPVMKLQNGLYSVAQQGAGLVNVLALIKDLTTVVPCKLELLDNVPQRVSLTITNHGRTFRSFTFESTNALSIRYGNNTIDSQMFNNKVEFTPSTLNLESGKSRKIFINIKPDPLMMDKDHWIYSGYIHIKSKEEVVNVPFAGFKGDYTSIPIFPSEYPAIMHNNKLVHNHTASFITAFDQEDVPVLVLRFVHSVQAIQVQLIGINNKKPIGLIYYDSHVPKHGNTYNKEDTSNYHFELPLRTKLVDEEVCVGCYSRDTGLKYWDEIPNGEYYLKVDAQRPMGKVNNKQHYDSWISPKMIVKRKRTAYGMHLLKKMNQ